jgi:hypothetical protein
MVTLTKALDLQSSITTETPAERARQAVAKYRAQCLDDVYHALLGIITSESAKGAVGLDLYHYEDSSCAYVEQKSNAPRYINSRVRVHINNAPLIDYETLVKRLESDGFDVGTMDSDDYGTIIDFIDWE